MSRSSPVVTATTDEDSGAACLATVLTSLGRPTTLVEARHRFGDDPTGSVITLTEVGRSFGLEMVPLAVDMAGLRDVPRPALLQWSTRFVVLDRRRFGRWTVLDPMIGRLRMTDRELGAQFTNTVLTTTPGPQFWSESTGGHEGWRILLAQAGRTPQFRMVLAAVIGLSVLMLAIGLASPVLTKLLVDDILPHRVGGVLPLVAVGVGLLTVTTFLANLLRGRMLTLVAGRLDDRLMTSLFAHMMALPYRFFRERSTGDLVQRFSSNAVIRNALTQQTVGGLLNIVQVIAFGAALLWISPVFGLWAVGLGVLEVAVLVTPARRIKQLTKAELEQVADTQSFTVEVATGAAYLKASGVEGGMLSSWARRLHDQLEASMRRQRFAAFIGATSSTLAQASGSVLLIVGVSQVLSGDLTLGTALALISLSASFLGPLALLITALQSLQAVQGHVDRITSVLQQPADQSNRLHPPMEPIQGRIELRDVGFRYGPHGPWAVRGISFGIEPGQRVAVVGASGSGKTTIAGIVLGLYPPDEGVVEIDGVDLHSCDLGSFRRQCGVVLQDPVIFEGTIRENVVFHDDEVSEADVERAVHLACLHDDVAAMPNGLDTVVGERGGSLSGGQRQRLALARALVRRPRLLILDEATGALDSVTESAVNGSLRQEAATTFVIAHRLSTVREADRILVLDRGCIVDAGTHAELIGRDGHYARLVAADDERPPVTPADIRKTISPPSAANGVRIISPQA